MAVSSRVIAFPYAPPPDAMFACLCLRAKAGEEAQVLRQIGGWAVLKIDECIGLFPLDYTVEKRKDFISDMCFSTNVDTFVFDEVGTAVNTSNEPKYCVRVQGSGESEGKAMYYRPNLHSRGLDKSDSSGSEGATLFTRVRALPLEIDYCLPEEETVADGELSCPDTGHSIDDDTIDGVRRVAAENLHAKGTGRRVGLPTKPLSRCIDSGYQVRLDRALQELQEQFVDLDLEVEWLADITDRLQATRQFLINANTSRNDAHSIQRQRGIEEGGEGHTDKLDVETLKQCLIHLQQSLTIHQANIDSASVSVAERNGGDYLNGLGKLWQGLAGSGLMAEVQSIQESIWRELETMTYYSAQRQRLCANADRLLDLKASMDEESWALKESEEALEAVAPAGTYKIAYSSSSNSNSYLTDSSHESSLVHHRQEASLSMASEEGVEEVEIVMKEGFVWPASVPGMLDNEKGAADGYQDVIRRYRQKLNQLRRDKGQDAHEKLCVIEKLQKALSTGDAALSALLKKVKEKKAFIARYKNMAAMIEEQLVISRKLLRRRQGNCHPSSKPTAQPTASKQKD